MSRMRALVRPGAAGRPIQYQGPSGERTMRTLPTKLSGMITALAVLACLTAARIQAEERDTNLRQQALKLNEITGTEARLGEQEKLLKDKAAAKKLVAEAARMAAEKPQPFTYNATLILGTVALGVKDYRAAETFYRLHLDQAKQLRSAKGLMAAYRGLVASAFAKHKYAQAERLCAEASQNEIILAAFQSLVGSGKDKNEELMSLRVSSPQCWSYRSMPLPDRATRIGPSRWSIAFSANKPTAGRGWTSRVASSALPGKMKRRSRRTKMR